MEGLSINEQISVGVQLLACVTFLYCLSWVLTGNRAQYD